MPRKSTRKQISLTVSAAQHEQTSALAGTEGVSAYIRRLIAEDATRRGVEFADNLPRPGKYKR